MSIGEWLTLISLLLIAGPVCFTCGRKKVSEELRVLKAELARSNIALEEHRNELPLIRLGRTKEILKRELKEANENEVNARILLKDLQDQTAFTEAQRAKMSAAAVEAVARSFSKSEEVIAMLKDKQAKSFKAAAILAELLAKNTEKLRVLEELVEDSEFLCSTCKAPLLQRSWGTIYGPNDQDAQVEYLNYECGAEFQDCDEVTPCPTKSKNHHR